ALAIPLAPRHLGAAETARDLDPDALGAGLHRALDRLLHRLAEGDPPAQLLGDAHGNEVRVQLRLADLLDLQLHLAVAERSDLLAQHLPVRPALADADAGLGGLTGEGDIVSA